MTEHERGPISDHCEGSFQDYWNELFARGIMQPITEAPTGLQQLLRQCCRLCFMEGAGVGINYTQSSCDAKTDEVMALVDQLPTAAQTTSDQRDLAVKQLRENRLLI